MVGVLQLLLEVKLGELIFDIDRVDPFGLAFGLVAALVMMHVRLLK